MMAGELLWHSAASLECQSCCTTMVYHAWPYAIVPENLKLSEKL